MKKTLLIIFIFGVCRIYAQYTENDIRNYIEQYKELAISKMYEFKIPASITIAQGIFESACGTSRLAKEGNNHFGIKCHKEWTGDTIKVDDDALQECFRKYTNVEESFDDHSNFLISRPRYSNLFTLEIMDYKAWAKGLKSAGYATNPNYAERLISLIERFNIAKLDTIYQERLGSGWFEKPNLAITDENKEEPKTEMNLLKDKDGVVFIPDLSQYKKVNYPFSNRPTYENNKVLFVKAQNGDTYAKIARDVQAEESVIRYYNDVPKGRVLVVGEIVYIEKKARNCSKYSHTLEEGETLHYISQKYGIRISEIMKANKLTEKSVVKVNSIIKLGKRKNQFFNNLFKRK